MEILPIRKMKNDDTCKTIGSKVRARRKALGITQAELAMTSGTGVRFIGDLESGKESCHLGKVALVLKTLGLGWAIAEGTGNK